MSGGIQQVVLSGPLILAIPIAAAAGAITFISPCCLPLVPGYLAYATGMSGTDAQAGGRRDRQQDRGTAASAGNEPPDAAGPGNIRVAVEAPAAAPARPGRGRTMAGTMLFVLGFSALFATYGAASGGLGALLTHHQAAVIKVLGAVTIVLGLLFAGIFDRFSFAGRVVRPSLRPRAGLAGAPLLGVTFLIVSLAFQRSMRVFSYVRRHARAVTRIGGAMLVVVGLLEVTGAWATAITWMQIHWQNGYQSPL
jgi:cytochrome c-type biogenesis protein